jgi:hypothetical protein
MAAFFSAERSIKQMTTPPNQYTLTEGGTTYGLHIFPLSHHVAATTTAQRTMICQLHPSGSWMTLGPPTADQIRHFEQYGTKSELPPIKP